MEDEVTPGDSVQGRDRGLRSQATLGLDSGSQTQCCVAWQGHESHPNVFNF